MLEDFISEDLLNFADLNMSDNDSESIFEDSADDEMYSKSPDIDYLDETDYNSSSDQDTAFDVCSDDGLFTDDVTYDESNLDSEFDMTESSSRYETQQEGTRDESYHRLYRRFIPSFTGVGRCSCGCGSFMGNGNICESCGHLYEAHSRYKK